MNPVERTSMKRWGRVLAAAALLGGCATAGPGAAEKLPNVLLILSDDQRADTIAALGSSWIETPNLDRLVREGTAFTRAVAPNPVCVPSRAEILTGCSGFRNGVLPGFTTAIRPGVPLWPEVMRRAGYRTWFSGKSDVVGRPGTRGFEESLGLFTGTRGPHPPQVDARGRPVTGYRGWMFQTEEGRTFPEKGVGLTPQTNVHIADAAIEFLRRPPDRPFFLSVNFTASHDPLLPPPGGGRRYDPARIPLPSNFLAEHPFDHGNREGRDELLWPTPRTERDVREELALYATVITHLDEQVGRVLDALRATGQAERTIVIFASDQGLAIGSHGLRGKQNMYDPTVGAPLVFSGPGIPRGARRRAQVYLRELFPTVCERAGIPIPEGVEGRSFARVLAGEVDAHHEAVFGYFMDAQRMIRTERWKLIRYPRIGRTQLYDLAADPDERADLADDPRHRAVKEELGARLAAWQREVGDPLLKR